MPSTNGSSTRKKSPMKEMGLSGLNFDLSGNIDEEFLPNLQGKNAIEAYREMRDNDPMVGAILFSIDGLARSAEWKADGDEDTPEENVQFLQECMDDMSHSFPDFISETLSMLPFGFSFSEIVYKRRIGPQKETSKTPTSRFSDGRIGWRKFAPRSQDSLVRWEFDDNGGVKAYVQAPPPEGDEITIPMHRGLLFRTTSVKNNPQGRSILRNAYRPWYYKKRIEEIEATGIERDLAGLPIAYVPPDIMNASAGTEELKMLSAIRQIVRNIKRDKEEGVIWPLAYDGDGRELFRLELMNSGGSRQFNTTEIIARYDQRIAMTALADFILLGHEKVGSFALSSDKTDLFAVALGMYLQQIEEVLNRYAVPRLFAVNGMPLENLPKIVHGDIESKPLGDVGAFITALVAAGMPLFPDEKLEAHVRELVGFPEKGEDAEPVLPAQANMLAMQQTGGDSSQVDSDTRSDNPPTPANSGRGGNVARRRIGSQSGAGGSAGDGDDAALPS